MTAVEGEARTGAATRFPPDLVRRIVAHMEAGTLDTAPHTMTEPASVFTDRDRFEREVDELFRHGAHVVGWTGELAGPNTYVTKLVAGLPVLITRDEHGELHAFRNACTHRGAQVAHEECGSARRLTCPYHSWSFDLAGRLAGQPDADAFADLDPAELGLQPLPLADVAGLLVVGLSDDVDPAAEFAEIAPHLQWCGYPNHEVVCRHEWQVQANWKIAFDVNLEGYHIAHLHRETLHSFVVNNSIYDTFGRHARWGFPTRAMAESVGVPEHEWPDPAPISIIHTFFPSCIVLETPVSSQMFRIYPGAHPGVCTVELIEASLRPVGSEDERAARKAGADFAAVVVGTEDFPAAEQCQLGAEVGLTHFRFGTNEPMLQHWHHVWREAIEDVEVTDTGA